MQNTKLGINNLECVIVIFCNDSTKENNPQILSLNGFPNSFCFVHLLMEAGILRLIPYFCPSYTKKQVIGHKSPKKSTCHVFKH